MWLKFTHKQRSDRLEIRLLNPSHCPHLLFYLGYFRLKVGSMKLQLLVPPDQHLVLIRLLLFLDLLLLSVLGTPLLVCDGSLGPWSRCLALGLHGRLQAGLVHGGNLYLDVAAAGHLDHLGDRQDDLGLLS